MAARRTPRQSLPAFTLVELLTVIGIAGVVMTMVLLAVGAVRKSARQAETLARFNAIDAGLEGYRSSLDQDYPPSAGLYDLQAGVPVVVVAADPELNSAGQSTGEDTPPALYGPEGDENPPVPITGANLLVWALAGRDLLGTPGFVDLNGDGSWWDDPVALYELEDSAGRQPRFRRHGPFVDLQSSGIVGMTDFDDHQALPDEQFMTDGFGAPILYYRARRGAPLMVSTVSGAAGVYSQSDNALYTGDGSNGALGLDLGGGSGHRLNQFLSDGAGVFEVTVHPDPRITDLDQALYDGSFAKFIRDRDITVRNQPVNRETYLLISAGPDGLWGTNDDITNFKR